MNKTNVLTMLGLCTAGMMPSCKEQPPKQTRLNIIFIMSDDHAYKAFGSTNGLCT